MDQARFEELHARYGRIPPELMAEWNPGTAPRPTSRALLGEPTRADGSSLEYVRDHGDGGELLVLEAARGPSRLRGLGRATDSPVAL